MAEARLHPEGTNAPIVAGAAGSSTVDLPPLAGSPLGASTPEHADVGAN
jgi:hypothetical protein